MTTSTLGVEEGDVGRVLEGDERQGKSGCRGNTEFCSTESSWFLVDDKYVKYFLYFKIDAKL